MALTNAKTTTGRDKKETKGMDRWEWAEKKERHCEPRDQHTQGSEVRENAICFRNCSEKIETREMVVGKSGTLLAKHTGGPSWRL